MRGIDVNNSYNGFFKGYSSLNSRPYIRIYRDNLYEGRRPSSGIYWTTIHELAHSTHWKQNKILGISPETKVMESFATGIAWYLTKKVHPTYFRPYSPIYTGIVQDLLDNDGYKWNTSIPETVSGFSIAEIEESVIGAVTWNQWADNIVSLYPYNPTISDVYNLFTIW